MLVAPGLEAALLAALFGLLVGSFLNVVVYRYPRMLERQWAAECADFQGQPVKEEEPFHCIRCNKPFGVKSTIERVAAKLEGKHWMFQNSAQRLDVIKMCEDCRVIAITEQEFDPYGAPARPKVRTTEDYLREREDAERADKPET